MLDEGERKGYIGDVADGDVDGCHLFGFGGAFEVTLY